MERVAMLAAVGLLCWSCSVSVVTAIQRADMFPYGPLSGDLILQEGDDETSKVLQLPRPLYFYSSYFSQLYVATNGIISAQDLPMEKQYVDDGLPTDFPVVAPFLADIDTSGGRGQIYYRVTETPSVLNRVAQEVHRGFPDAKFTPTHAVVATWENVAAYEEQTRTSGPSNKLNTFQAVIGYDETDSYVLFLYPEGGLNFFGTRPKESYNVEIELPARVGFSRGEIAYLIFSRIEGPYYSVTSDEQSVKNLYQVGNTGIPGIWLFHSGNRYSFNNIVPASIGGLLTTSPTGGHGVHVDTTTPEYGEFEEYTDSTYPDKREEEDDDYPLTGGDPEFQPAPSGREHSEPLPVNPDAPSSPSENPGEVAPPPPDPRYRSEQTEPQYGAPNPPQTEEQQPQVPPLEVVDVYPPRSDERPPSPGGHVVSVDEEDVDFDTGVIQYTTENKETCARFKQQCSQNAFCTDYDTGFCCHCQSGFYGNGRHCLPDGAPQRVSGKMSGTVTVGSTAVQLGSIDLHAYVVVGDGRAYTAISEVPEPVGWALMPVAPIGELFGWLFALELPNSQSGFKIAGAEFTRRAEVIFYPGNERLSIIQTGRGLDDNNHLTVDTVVNGKVPFIAPGAEVTMDPFKETYQYYPSVATSTSVREFMVVSAERGSESFSFQLKQNITYRDCRHDNRATALETLQITMERVFVMYVKEERILRYAITNKISPVGVEPLSPELINPCYSGNHDCDTTAQCIPLEGQSFQCQCATGYRGDGRNCYDIDECAEGLTSCGAHAQCVNLPGSHRCQCQAGFEFGYDGRTCVDIDECSSSPCHASARCINGLGSFQCQCQPGFYGDGFYCSHQEGNTGRPRSQCEQHRDSLQSGVEAGGQPVGAFIPQCDSDGRYRSLQCHGSTGHCWCVDSSGQERTGTRTPPGTAPKDCDKPDEPDRLKTHCEHHRDSVQTTGPDGDRILGAFVPECDANGQYRPLQCHGSTGHCWCVDSSGQERAGTRTPPGVAPKDCDKPVEPERPKTHCEHHRDSIQGSGPQRYPIIGIYIPQCDDHGHYIPRQCHGSSGQCWCVDSNGEEIQGTRTQPGETHRDCSKPVEPQRPKTRCEHHRDSIQTTSPEGYPLLGVFVPECDTNGHYTPQQCHGSTGHCWCVDSNGEEIDGSRTQPGETRRDCSKPFEPERPKTHCEHHRDSIQGPGPQRYPIIGIYIPQCDEHGEYIPQQCHSSSGYCWCVDRNGEEIRETRTPVGVARIDCRKLGEPQRPKTHCEHHRDNIQTTSPEGYPLLGVFVPECDANGQYTPQQCHGSTGHCWCVDSNGEEIDGSRTQPGETRRDCSKPYEPQHPKTRCQHHKDSIQTTSPEGYPIVGIYIPQCDEHGHYIPRQCHGSSGQCWCVDSNGEEIQGTRTQPGETRRDCSKPVEPQRPKTRCEHHRDSIQTTNPEGYPLLGVFVPECDTNGHYTPQQCHGSTGHCWCVDSNGEEIDGSRTQPGETRRDCSKPFEPERPKTHCEHHRDSIQTTSPEGYPLLGVFVPECDANGQYTPQQCHGSTGHCWCVDSNGEEIDGSRTQPGETRRDCSKPFEPDRLKTQCEHHRDSVQTSQVGYPVAGIYIPQCDANGEYMPLQCHGSTGYCWCVDSRGQERTGTRTSPGSPPTDCDKPVEPQRPKTHCEHHRDSVQTTGPDGDRIFGVFVPQCDANGQYIPQQCHGSTGHCWCVDSNGQERAGTKTPPGSPRFDCDKPVEPPRPKTHCEHHRDSVQTTGPDGDRILGAFVPECDANGQYRPLQCHGSTGHCWCVDSSGQERTGTRTPPGVAPKDCDKPVEPQRPKTHCEHHRDSVQTTGPDGDRIFGVFVPQCDANGQYIPQQCHGSTGHCWCVDSNGQERAGTKTPPGSPRFDCDKPVPVAPTQRPESVCERWRASLVEHYGGKPDPQNYLPQCEPDGHFSPVQCYGESTYCWCVDQDGREISGTRSHDVVKPGCLPTVAPPTVRPVPRPDVTPPPKTDITLLYAQGQKIGALPLNGTRLDAARSKTLLTLHGSIVVGIAYDCKENHVYWTDLSARTINRASMVQGAEPEILINTNLVSPEGLAVDVKRRMMFWVDSNPDMIESANLDGSGRKTLFDTDLVNPRAIIVVSSTGTLYWTDWNREAPKIECSMVDGQNRRVVVSDGVGLPNALTYDSSAGQICWADAGTKRLECISPDGSGRRVIHPSLNYPFSMVYYRNHFYYTDWRRDGVIAVSKDSSQFTDEYLPDQRSHLYGIAIATTHCLSGSH